jgi:hypothetical protein
MTADATYFAVPSLAPPRHLQRAGQWEIALALTPDDEAGAALRAEILVDRHGWRLDPPDEALAAVDVITAGRPELAVFLTAQLEYWRRLRGRSDEPIGAGLIGTDLAAALARVADEAKLGGWGRFWHAIVLDNLMGDTAGAAAGYASALSVAQASGDQLLESYAVRHQGGHAMDAGDSERAIALFRRSLQLRAARGARPQTAAAQASLADALGATPEAAELRAIASATARELGLTWLLPEADS